MECIEFLVPKDFKRPAMYSDWQTFRHLAYSIQDYALMHTKSQGRFYDYVNDMESFILMDGYYDHLNISPVEMVEKHGTFLVWIRTTNKDATIL